MVGAASSAYHLAYQLADKYGVVSSNEKTVPELIRRVKAMDCYERMTSMIPLNIPIIQMIERKDEVQKKFIEIAKYQINEEGAQLIVGGCGAMFPALGVGSKEKLEQILGVPILDGPSIALRTLEMLVHLKLTHSKKTYPSPI